MKLHQEKFEAWLFSQPDDRTYSYMDINDCLVCKYIKENTSIKRLSAGNKYFRIYDECDYNTEVPFPQWLSDFETDFSMMTKFGQVKEAYVKRFGNPLAEPLSPAPAGFVTAHSSLPSMEKKASGESITTHPIN